MDNRKFRLAILMTMVVTLLLSSTVTSFGATKTKKMTVYNQVLKSGKYAYCCDGYRVYRVNLKTKKKINLVKRMGAPDAAYMWMKKKGNYIYCAYSDTETKDIYRLNIKKRSPKKIAKEIYLSGYYLSKNRLYYDGLDLEMNEINRVMKLNGKSNRKSNVKCKIKIKNSNAKGYNVIVKDDYNGHVKSWLKLPSGKKIKLGEYTYPSW